MWIAIKCFGAVDEVWSVEQGCNLSPAELFLAGAVARHAHTAFGLRARLAEIGGDGGKIAEGDI